MVAIVTSAIYQEYYVEQFGRNLLNNYRDKGTHFEDVAQKTVEEVYQTFRHEANEADFALVRVFRVSRYGELPSPLQNLTDGNHLNYLSLMATIGDKPAWCQCQTSQTHQVLPINHNLSPMFKGVFNALGFSWEDEHDFDQPHGKSAGSPINQYFFVPSAAASPYITDQDDFVKPYNIQSVVAFGSRFLSGAAYVLIGFSKRSWEPLHAKMFASVVPYVSTLLAVYDGRHQLWGAK